MRKLKKNLIFLGLMASMSIVGTSSVFADVNDEVSVSTEVDESDTESDTESDDAVKETEVAANTVETEEEILSDDINLEVSKDTDNLSEDASAPALESEEKKTETEQQIVKEALRNKVSAGVITEDEIGTTVEKLLSDLDEQEKKDFIAELKLLVPQADLEEEMQSAVDDIQDMEEATFQEEDTDLSSIKSRIRDSVSKGWIYRSEIGWYINKLLPSLPEEEKAAFAEELHALAPMDYELLEGLKARLTQDVLDGMIEEDEIEWFVNSLFDGTTYLDEADKAAFVEELIELMPEELNPKRLEPVVLPGLNY